MKMATVSIQLNELALQCSCILFVFFFLISFAEAITVEVSQIIYRA